MYMQEIKNLSEAQLALLKAPLPEKALKPHPTKKNSEGTPMTTIKPQYVIDRLNEVFGVGGWQFKTREVHHEKNIRTTAALKERIEFTTAAHSSLIVEQYGIHLECIAGNTNDDLGDAFKGAGTDALTKMASYLGIGADIWRGTQDNKKPAAKPTETPQPITPPTTKIVTPKAENSMAPNEAFALSKEIVDAIAAVKTVEDLRDLSVKYKGEVSFDVIKAELIKKGTAMGFTKK